MLLQFLYSLMVILIKNQQSKGMLAQVVIKSSYPAFEVLKSSIQELDAEFPKIENNKGRWAIAMKINQKECSENLGMRKCENEFKIKVYKQKFIMKGI